MVKALVSIPGGCGAHSDLRIYIPFHLRPAIFNTILDSEPSGKSIIFPHLVKKFNTRKLFEGDWINFKTALQRAPQAVKDATVKEFLSEVPPLGKGYWEFTDNPLVTLKIHGCRFNHRPLPGSGFTAQQYLLNHNDLNSPAVAFLLKWLVDETGLDCKAFIPLIRETNNPLYPGRATTVREYAIQSGCRSLCSVVLDIPHVPLLDVVPEAFRAIFAQRVHQESAEYIATFLRYPSDIVDVLQWASSTAAVHDAIPPQWRMNSASEFIRFVGSRVVQALKWICANRVNGKEEMREAGRWIQEWLRQEGAVEEQIPEPINTCVVGIFQWMTSQ